MLRIRRPLRGHQAAKRQDHSHSATVSHGSLWSFCVHLCSYRFLYCVPQVLRSSSLICSMLSTECTVRPQNAPRYPHLAGSPQLRAPPETHTVSRIDDVPPQRRFRLSSRVLSPSSPLILAVLDSIWTSFWKPQGPQNIANSLRRSSTSSFSRLSLRRLPWARKKHPHSLPRDPQSTSKRTPEQPRSSKSSPQTPLGTLERRLNVTPSCPFSPISFFLSLLLSFCTFGTRFGPHFGDLEVPTNSNLFEKVIKFEVFAVVTDSVLHVLCDIASIAMWEGHQIRSVRSCH